MNEFLLSLRGDNGNGQVYTKPPAYSNPVYVNSNADAGLGVASKNSTGGSEQSGDTWTVGSNGVTTGEILVAFQAAQVQSAGQGSVSAWDTPQILPGPAWLNLFKHKQLPFLGQQAIAVAGVSSSGSFSLAPLAFSRTGTISAVGSSFGGNPAATTFSLTPNTAGDLILVEIIDPSGSTVVPTSLSSSNVTWLPLGTPFTGSTNVRSAQVFIGTVTSTGTATVTTGWSGTPPSSIHYAGQEFSSTAGASSVTLNVQGNLDSTGTSTWASLTPAAAGELYFGFALDSGSAVAGSTPGYTYNANVDGNGNGLAYNPACTSSAQAPVWGDAGQAIGIMVLVASELAGKGNVSSFDVPQILPGPFWFQLFKPGSSKPPIRTPYPSVHVI